MRRTGRLEFAAARRIEPGEEITLDYGTDYFDLIIAETGCRCMTCEVKTLRRTHKVGKNKAADRKAKKKKGKAR